MSSLFIDLANCDHLKDRQEKSSQSKFESDVAKAKHTAKTDEELYQKKRKEFSENLLKKDGIKNQGNNKVK